MYKKTTIISIFLSSITCLLFSQTNFKAKKQADSLYRAKNYALAGPAYLNYSEIADFKVGKIFSIYDAACSYALANKTDSAFLLLNKAIELGYNDEANLTNDKDFASLKTDVRWQEILVKIRGVKKELNTNPVKAKIHTEDINRLWEAYDKAQKDTANQIAIFKQYYFDKASDGLNDYAGSKIGSIASFVRHYKNSPKFYASIRNTTLQVEGKKKEIYMSFKNLKKLYNEALFPDVYFVMGAFTSGGTVSPNGLLIGTDQMVKTGNEPLDELNLWQRNNFAEFKNLPAIVSHELIHFQQNNMKGDTMTLRNAIVEGMADFIGELISGVSINKRVADWAKGKEKSIWARFQKDMYLNKAYNWIANSQQETPDFPADQGYWVGYQICKAYYDKSTDKKQAIYDMLHIQDYKKFLEDSRVEKKFQ